MDLPLSTRDPLIQQAVAGDREALQALIRTHHDSLQRALRGRIPARWQSMLAVQDVLQETYVDALRNIRTFTPQGADSFRRWLLTIARNNLRSAIESLAAEKRGGRVRRLSSSHDACRELLARAAGETSPSRELVRCEIEEILKRALRRLPDPQRRVVWEYDVEGQPMPRIATALGRSEGAAYMLRRRALHALQKLLRQSLADYCDES